MLSTALMLPLVVRVEDVQSRRATTYTFTSSPVHIGRSELNDLALTQPFVSLWHAIFWFDDTKVQCADLGSTNGTMLENEPLAKGIRTELKPASDLRIGTLKVSFTREAGAGTGASVEPARRATMFGNRASGGPPPGSTLAFDPHQLASVPANSPAPPPGTSTAVTIMHEGPLDLSPPTPVAAAAPIAALPSAPPPATGTGTPVTKFTAPPKPLAVPPASASEPVLQLVSQTAAPYMDFRHSWRVVLDRIRQGMAQLPDTDRPQAAQLLQSRFPALAHEEEYQAIVRGLGISAALPEPLAPPVPDLPGVPMEGTPVQQTPLARTFVRAVESVSPVPPIQLGSSQPSATAAAGVATQLLTQFAQSYAPQARALAGPQEIEGFLDRIAALLETFANAFIELRKGKDQFEKEVGVSLSGAKGALKRAKNVEEVLRYLTDVDDGHPRKPEELIRGFAEVMIHHVALLNGIREGARGLLLRLSPDALAKAESGPRAPKTSALRDVLDLAFPTRARWRRFLGKHQALLEEEDQMTQALFGPEFARAYTSVASDSVDAEPPTGGTPS